MESLENNHEDIQVTGTDSAEHRNKQKRTMPSPELASRISGAIRRADNAIMIDDTLLNDCIDNIVDALLSADVQSELVRNLSDRLRNIINLSVDNHKLPIFPEAIFTVLCSILDSGKPSFILKKGEVNVVMFVGLQVAHLVGKVLTYEHLFVKTSGSGKTAACNKYASYHKKKGWKPALVCARSLGAGDFDQLNQKAAKAQIPFYGSYTELDPVKIAVDGVEAFKKENCDLIILDMSRSHKREAAFFEEIHTFSQALKPDLVLYVMDSRIGQAAFHQAQAFRQTVPAGAVVVTKLGGHAKGVGALTAVATAKCPIMFIGTGKDLKVFEARSFVGRRLDIDYSISWRHRTRVPIPIDEETLTLRLRRIYQMYQDSLIGGPMKAVHNLSIRGFDVEIPGRERESQLRKKLHMTIMDSMAAEELDNPLRNLIISKSRVLEIARDSGRSAGEVKEMVKQYRRMARKCPSMRKMRMLPFSYVIPPEVITKLAEEVDVVNRSPELEQGTQNGVPLLPLLYVSAN